MRKNITVKFLSSAQSNQEILLTDTEKIKTQKRPSIKIFLDIILQAWNSLYLNFSATTVFQLSNHQTALIGELDANWPRGYLFLRSTSSWSINVFCCRELIWDFREPIVSSSSYKNYKTHFLYYFNSFSPLSSWEISVNDTYCVQNLLQKFKRI